MYDRAWVLSLSSLRCRSHAEVCIASLRRWAEDVPIVVFGDDVEWLKGLDVAHWSVIYEPKMDFGDKVSGFLYSGAQKGCFLDADLVCVSDPGLLWRLLDWFDVVCSASIWRCPAGRDGLVVGLPQWNTGLVGWRRSPAVYRFFARWWERFEAERTERRLAQLEQSIFAEELVGSGLRVYTLPDEWNCRALQAGFIGAGGAVVFSHGSPRVSAPAAERFNAVRGLRVFRRGQLV